MQTLFLQRTESRRLIAVFLGWAMDWHPFANLSRPGYDIVLVWDYSTPVFPAEEWKDYDEICVIGWSMGVYFCAQLPEWLERKVTRRIAVNGTLTPMHDLTGIPENIFLGTLNGLNERNLEKFYMRVCGTREAYSRFKENAPTRTLAELRDELAGMTALPYREGSFDIALIGENDAIFPPQNQQRAWADIPAAILDCGHLPDFRTILNRYVIDKERVKRQFCKGFHTYEQEARAQNSVAGYMAHWLRRHKLGRVLEVGSGTGMLSRRIRKLAPEHFEMWDLCPAPPYEGADFRCVDAETAIMDAAAESYDAIVSASAIQWFNSPATFLKHASEALKPGGIMAVGTYTRGNLDEITSLLPASLPLMSREEWLSIIPEAMEVEEVFEYEYPMSFQSPMDALRHLKLTGVNSLGRSGGAVLSVRDLIEQYKPGTDGLWHLTYRPIIIYMQKK